MAINPNTVNILNINELQNSNDIQNSDLLVIGQGIFARKATVLSLYNKFGIDVLKNSVDSLTERVEDIESKPSVLYTPQLLTAPEQQTARENIKAAFADDVAALQGITLEADQANAIVYVKDGNGQQLASLNVGFLNNEGTTFRYNETTKKLELLNDQGELLSSVLLARLFQIL